MLMCREMLLVMMHRQNILVFKLPENTQVYARQTKNYAHFNWSIYQHSNMNQPQYFVLLGPNFMNEI